MQHQLPVQLACRGIIRISRSNDEEHFNDDLLLRHESTQQYPTASSTTAESATNPMTKGVKMPAME
jgi:hypothetical protein